MGTVKCPVSERRVSLQTSFEGLSALSRQRGNTERTRLAERKGKLKGNLRVARDGGRLSDEQVEEETPFGDGEINLKILLPAVFLRSAEGKDRAFLSHHFSLCLRPS
mmetsp:Transcript_17502/g.35532  ORF Transcript_17502/g.35532 Transcript_17502/m.35532 type:complete len:107 (-) Transcript_17502:209-529(-)